MRTRSRTLHVALAVVSIACFTTALSAQAQRMTAPESLRDGLTRALLDTLAGRLTALELERAELIASNRAAGSDERRSLEQHTVILRQLLDELPDSRAARAFAATHALRAVEARLASLAVTRRLREAEQRAGTAEARGMAAAEAVLQQRRVELQRIVAEPGSPPPT